MVADCGRRAGGSDSRVEGIGCEDGGGGISSLENNLFGDNGGELRGDISNHSNAWSSLSSPFIRFLISSLPYDLVLTEGVLTRTASVILISSPATHEACLPSEPEKISWIDLSSRGESRSGGSPSFIFFLIFLDILS